MKSNISDNLTINDFEEYFKTKIIKPSPNSNRIPKDSLPKITQSIEVKGTSRYVCLVCGKRLGEELVQTRSSDENATRVTRCVNPNCTMYGARQKGKEMEDKKEAETKK